ncbi:MAG: hypothetical protein JW751_22230 [Polyangiaceae bacterium]|nr:hypothetical protein [Polyangiaceae bacterium]
MTAGSRLGWTIGSAEDWRQRMATLVEQGVEAPVVFIVGSGLSFDCATGRGVADVGMIVEELRKAGVDIGDGTPPEQYQRGLNVLSVVVDGD